MTDMPPLHPACAMFPPLDEAGLASMAESILARGQRDPIVMHEGQILDGRNRWLACRRAGVEPITKEWEPSDTHGDSPTAYAFDMNRERRHLTPSQWSMVGATTIPLFGEEARKRQAHGGTAPGKTLSADLREASEHRKAADDAAAAVGVSPRSVENAAAVLATGSPELAAAVNTGELSVSRAAALAAPAAEDVREAKKAEKAAARSRHEAEEARARADAAAEAQAALEAERQARIEAEARARAAEKTARALEEERRQRDERRARIQERREQQAAALDDIAAREAKAAQGVYDVLVIDPPWPMQKIEREVRPNQVAFDYPTMTEAELRDLEIPAADGAHIWLWTTHRFLPMAFRLLDAWGLKYVCTFVWHKPGGFQPVGLPQYNCEFALYAHKGAPIFTETKGLPVCFNAPRGAHSEKPEEFYALLRRVTRGRRLDMFNRRVIGGFDGWGKEAHNERLEG